MQDMKNKHEKEKGRGEVRGDFIGVVDELGQVGSADKGILLAPGTTKGDK